jgi:hypothetical protein
VAGTTGVLFEGNKERGDLDPLGDLEPSGTDFFKLLDPANKEVDEFWVIKPPREPIRAPLDGNARPRSFPDIMLEMTLAALRAISRTPMSGSMLAA